MTDEELVNGVKQIFRQAGWTEPAPLAPSEPPAAPVDQPAQVETETVVETPVNTGVAENTPSAQGDVDATVSQG